MNTKDNNKNLINNIYENHNDCEIDINGYNNDLNYEVPLNILKEKILFCLPPGTELEEDTYIAFSKALNHFLKYFATKLPYQQENNEKKILIKDIKNCLENNQSLSFLKKLIEK